MTSFLYVCMCRCMCVCVHGVCICVVCVHVCVCVHAHMYTVLLICLFRRHICRQDFSRGCELPSIPRSKTWRPARSGYGRQDARFRCVCVCVWVHVCVGVCVHVCVCVDCNYTHQLANDLLIKTVGNCQPNVAEKLTLNI